MDMGTYEKFLGKNMYRRNFITLGQIYRAVIERERNFGYDGEDVEAILRTGIWRVPDFGTPPENLQPIILAAHRWGYLEWSASFRKLNSFYHLPQLKVGDTIKVIWEQRQYEYKVYSTETGTQITDYNAKLILYTCQLWNSPVRFFVYANRNN